VTGDESDAIAKIRQSALDALLPWKHDVARAGVEVVNSQVRQRRPH